VASARLWTVVHERSSTLEAAIRLIVWSTRDLADRRLPERDVKRLVIPMAETHFGRSTSVECRSHSFGFSCG
jgi:hypothetical protein